MTRDCCIWAEGVADEYQSGGCPPGEGQRKGSKMPIVDVIWDVQAYKWRTPTVLIVRCNSAHQAVPRPCPDGGSGGRRPNNLRAALSHRGRPVGSTAVASGSRSPSPAGSRPPSARGGGAARWVCSSRMCQSSSLLVLNSRPQVTHFSAIGGSSRSTGRLAGCTPPCGGTHTEGSISSVPVGKGVA